MAITLNPDNEIAAIVDARSGWTLVVERDTPFVKLVAIRPDGTPCGRVSVHKNNLAALIEALVAAE